MAGDKPTSRAADRHAAHAHEAPRAHRQHRRTAEHLAGQGGPAHNNFANVTIKTDQVVAHNSTILSI